EQDDWGGEPDEAPATEYAGRRRGGSALRTWLGIAAALVILAGAVGLPVLLHSSPPAKASGAAAGQNPPDNNGDLVAPVPGETTNTPTVGASGQLGGPASSGPAAPGATPGPGQTTPGSGVHETAPGIPAPPSTTQPGPQPTTQPAPPPTTNQPPPPPPLPFQPTTIQAETGTLGGTAAVRTPPMCGGGGQVVGPLGSVTMTLPALPAAGAYRVEIFYTAPFGGQSASISANGGAGQSFSVGFATCPAAGPTVKMTLHSGTGDTLRLSGNTFALNIDRIVVSQA